MKIDCEVIRDILPLYADDACSEKSRQMVDEHLEECSACREELERIRKTEIDDSLRNEKTSVIRYGETRFRRRSAAVGSAMSGLFMIPILAYLVINIYTGSSLGVFFVVLASMLVAASLVIVPLMVPEDRAFWTFCAFCASLMLLLADHLLLVRPMHRPEHLPVEIRTDRSQCPMKCCRPGIANGFEVELTFKHAGGKWRLTKIIT